MTKLVPEMMRDGSKGIASITGDGGAEYLATESRSAVIIGYRAVLQLCKYKQEVML